MEGFDIDLPSKMLHALKQAFNTQDVPEEKEKLMTLCRGTIKEHYLLVSLKECNFVSVGGRDIFFGLQMRLPAYHFNHIVTVILAYTHKNKHSFCKPHELYLAWSVFLDCKKKHGTPRCGL